MSDEGITIGTHETSSGFTPTFVLREDIARAFTEWDRRWREDPRGFTSDVERLLDGQTVEEYGDAAAATFLHMIQQTTEGAV